VAVSPLTPSSKTDPPGVGGFGVYGHGKWGCSPFDGKFRKGSGLGAGMLPPMAETGRRLETIDRLLSILERAGTWGLAAMSLIPGGGAYVWASTIQIPGPVAAVLGLYGVAGGLWLHAGLTDLRRQRRKRESLPDYDKWNLVITFTFAQAANLWTDRRPDMSMDDSSYAVFRMLKEQAQAGELPANPVGPSFHRDSLVLRGDLLKLARRMKQRPIFLFNKNAR
jgi:hypothetical protein